MQNVYRNCPTIKTGCVVAVQDFEKTGKIKAIRGDLRIGPSGQFVLTGVMFNNKESKACFFISERKHVDIFPSSCWIENEKTNYENYCCVILEIPFKASKRFVEYVSESCHFYKIGAAISQVTK